MEKWNPFIALKWLENGYKKKAVQFSLPVLSLPFNNSKINRPWAFSQENISWNIWMACVWNRWKWYSLLFSIVSFSAPFIDKSRFLFCTQKLGIAMVISAPKKRKEIKPACAFTSLGIAAFYHSSDDKMIGGIPSRRWNNENA